MALGRSKGGVNQYHSKEFKLEVTTRILNGQGSHPVADELGLSPGMVRNWVMKYKEPDVSGLENNKESGNPYAELHTNNSLT
jgi:transposase-like protein